MARDHDARRLHNSVRECGPRRLEGRDTRIRPGPPVCSSPTSIVTATLIQLAGAFATTAFPRAHLTERRSRADRDAERLQRNVSPN
jgi:hypothetical protein